MAKAEFLKVPEALLFPYYLFCLDIVSAKIALRYDNPQGRKRHVDVLSLKIPSVAASRGETAKDLNEDDEI